MLGRCRPGEPRTSVRGGSEKPEKNACSLFLLRQLKLAARLLRESSVCSCTGAEALPPPSHAPRLQALGAEAPSRRRPCRPPPTKVGGSPSAEIGAYSCVGAGDPRASRTAQVASRFLPGAEVPCSRPKTHDARPAGAEASPPRPHPPTPPRPLVRKHPMADGRATLCRVSSPRRDFVEPARAALGYKRKSRHFLLDRMAAITTIKPELKN